MTTPNMDTNERTEEARRAVEVLIEQYRDVFVDNSDLEMNLPVLSSWILLMVHDDPTDPTIISTYQMTARHQAWYISIGMMTVAIAEGLSYAQR